MSIPLARVVLQDNTEVIQGNKVLLGRLDYILYLNGIRRHYFVSKEDSTIYLIEDRTFITFLRNAWIAESRMVNTMIFNSHVLIRTDIPLWYDPQTGHVGLANWGKPLETPLAKPKQMCTLQ